MSDETTTTQDAQAEEQTAMPDVRVEDVLHFAMNLFNEQAWVKLGIRASQSGGEAKMDLPQAKLAIDALAALVPLTEGRFDPHEVRDLKNLLASLQMNYVQRTTQQ